MYRLNMSSNLGISIVLILSALISILSSATLDVRFHGPAYNITAIILYRTTLDERYHAPVLTITSMILTCLTGPSGG